VEIDEDLAEILGAHIGDGCISRTQRYAEYYLGGDITEEREYHDKWIGPLFNRKIAIPLLNKKVNYKAHPKVGIYGFHIFDERLVKFFEDLGIRSGSKINIRIPNKIMLNKNLLTRFLRGLFDTDGNIYFDKNRSAKSPKNDRPVIKLGTVSKYLANDVFESLKSLGLHPRMKKPYQGKRDKNLVYTVLLYRMADVKYYIKEISFKNNKHMTKWQVYTKFGVCPPKTNLSQRKAMLLNPKLFNQYKMNYN